MESLANLSDSQLDQHAVAVAALFNRMLVRTEAECIRDMRKSACTIASEGLDRIRATPADRREINRRVQALIAAERGYLYTR